MYNFNIICLILANVYSIKYTILLNKLLNNIMSLSEQKKRLFRLKGDAF